MALTPEQNAAKNAIAAELAAYVHSIRIEDENRMPYLVGSGVLLRLGEKLVLLTAAHVLDENANQTLFVVTNTTSVILEGQKHATPSQYPDHRDDPLDVAVLELNDRTTAELANAPALRLENCDASVRPAPSTLYFACGFPHTSNRRVNRAARTVQARRFKLFSKSVGPAIFQTVNRNIDQHFVIGFNKRHVIQDNRDVTAPHPHGVSGGALWATDGVRRRVVAILTDWFYPQHLVKAMGGTRIGLFLRTAAERCQGLPEDVRGALINQ